MVGKMVEKNSNVNMELTGEVAQPSYQLTFPLVGGKITFEVSAAKGETLTNDNAKEGIWLFLNKYCYPAYYGDVVVFGNTEKNAESYASNSEWMQNIKQFSLDYKDKNGKRVTRTIAITGELRSDLSSSWKEVGVVKINTNGEPVKT